MKIFIACLLLVCTLLLCYIAFMLPSPENLDARKALISYDQFISISLTLITIVIAVVALLITYLAFVGKEQITKEVSTQAQKEASNLAKAVIEERLPILIKEQFDSLYADFERTGKLPSVFSKESIPKNLEEMKND